MWFSQHPLYDSTKTNWLGILPLLLFRNPLGILLSKHPKLKSSLEKVAGWPLKEKKHIAIEMSRARSQNSEPTDNYQNTAYSIYTKLANNPTHSRADHKDGKEKK